MSQIFQFNDEVHAYQRFVRENIKNLGDLTIISEQLLIKDMEKGFIDILALDNRTRRIVILELKNSSAGDDIVGQSIKYYDFLTRAESDLRELLAKMRNQVEYDIEEVNLNPRIMLVVPDFSQQLLRSLSYIQGIEVEVIRFNAIQHNGYHEIIRETYVPSADYREDAEVTVDEKLTKSWSFDDYVNDGAEKGKIALARQLMYFLDSLCKERNQKLDVFFYKDKITFMTGKKVMATAKISRKWFDDSLDISVSVNKEKEIKIPDLMYNSSILKYSVRGRSVKMNCAQLPTKVLSDIL